MIVYLFIVNNNKKQSHAFRERNIRKSKWQTERRINKTGLQLRETITAFLENNFERVENDFEKLTPKERVKLYCELLQFGLPKFQTTSLDVDFEKLTDEQLDFYY